MGGVPEFADFSLFRNSAYAVTQPGRKHQTSDHEIKIICDESPEDGHDQRHAGGADQIAVVIVEEPFAQARATGRGAYHENNPDHELTRQDGPLIRIALRQESEKQSIDYEKACRPCLFPAEFTVRQFAETPNQAEVAETHA